MDIDKDYVRNFFAKNFPNDNADDEEMIAEYLSGMSKYDNKWWESEDDLTAASYQIFEPLLMVPFGKFLRGMDQLLGRPVYDIELGLHMEKLQEEAREALSRLEREITTIAPEERQRKNIQMIEQIYDEFGDITDKYSEERKERSIQTREEVLEALKDIGMAPDSVARDKTLDYKKTEKQESYPDQHIPISDMEKKLLSDIKKDKGGKNSWICFDKYKSLLSNTAIGAGVSYESVIKSRKGEISVALNDAFGGISHHNPDLYYTFGKPRDDVLNLFEKGYFSVATNIIDKNFNTYML